MPKSDLSAITVAMAKSVEEAHEALRAARSRVSLEEMECTLTLEVEVNEEVLESGRENWRWDRVPGLQFREVISGRPGAGGLHTPLVPTRLVRPEMGSDPESGREATEKDVAKEPPQRSTLTVRAIFSVEDRE